MRAGIMSVILVLSAPVAAKQVEAEIGVGAVTGLMVGNVADGTLWMGSTLKLRADWAAFIEEDRSKRYRLGIEVPINERVALGLRPGLDFPITIVGQSMTVGLGLRSFVTPYTLHGFEAQVAWVPKLLGVIHLNLGGSMTAFFFGNDLPSEGALVEFQGLAGVRIPL